MSNQNKRIQPHEMAFRQLSPLHRHKPLYIPFTFIVVAAILLAALGYTVFKWSYESSYSKTIAAIQGQRMGDIANAKRAALEKAFRDASIITIIAALVCLILVYVIYRMDLAARRRARRFAACCVHCGYSLTGNTSGVCPECGTAVEANIWP